MGLWRYQQDKLSLTEQVDSKYQEWQKERQFLEYLCSNQFTFGDKNIYNPILSRPKILNNYIDIKTVLASKTDPLCVLE